jgi:hypothetical protein
MPEILFVHGTGVRRVSYGKSLSLVRSQAKRYLNGAEVHACLWGEPKGARLRLAGKSIPTYDEQPAPSIGEREAEEIELVTWRMLREDPLFELRLLENMPSASQLPEERGPLDATAGERSCQLVRDLIAPAELIQILRDRELESSWSDARQSFAALGELESILTRANRDPREVSKALSRGLVANLVNVAILNGHSGISSETRDRLVALLVPCWGSCL